jgi:hypothetical protein
MVRRNTEEGEGIKDNKLKRTAWNRKKIIGIRIGETDEKVG